MKHKKVWFGTAITLSLMAIAVAFAKPFNFENILFRVRANTVTAGTIVFQKSKTTRSGTTNSTPCNSRDSGSLILKTYNNVTSKSNGYIGALSGGSTMRFYEGDGVTEFTFQDLDKIQIEKEAEANSNFSFTLHALYTDGRVFTNSYTITAYSSSKTYSFTGASYGDVSNIWIECTSNEADIARITQVTITYNCTTKYQTATVISAAPTKTVYEEGDTFDPTGMIVSAKYSDDSTVATNYYTYSPSGVLHPDVSYITIFFNGYSVNQPITVNALPELLSIYVATAPAKTSYKEGDNFNPTGMVIKGTFADSVDRVISEYTYSPSGALTTSDTTITISATVGGITKQTTQSITVSEDSLSGTYTYAFSSYNYTIVLNSDYTGYYHFVNTEYSYNHMMHFGWSVSGSTITFTKNAQSGDSQMETGSYYNLFTNNGSYNTTNTGTINAAGNIVIYTCSNTMRTSSAKTCAKIV